MRSYFVALAAVLFASVPTAAQPPGTFQERDFLAAAGVEFPDRLAGFALGRIYSLGPQLVGATYYQRDPGPIEATVEIHVTAATAPIAAELERSEASAASAVGRVTLVRELPAPRRAPGARGRLWRGESDGRSILIGVVIWQRDGWQIKIRAVVSGDQMESGWAAVERLIDEFDWGSAPASPQIAGTSTSRSLTWDAVTSLCGQPIA